MRAARRFHRWLIVLALIAAATACSGRTTPLAGIGKEEGAPVDSARTDAPSRGPGSFVSTPPRTQSSSGAQADHPAQPAPSPSPYDPPFPADPAVKVDALLTPVCAHNGSQMKLAVETNPDAAVGYQAIYSDNHGGGPAPYGSGYGGNGHGLADATGHFTSTWVISQSAPSGVARVDVVVGWQGKYGYQSLTFHVGPGATCT